MASVTTNVILSYHELMSNGDDRVADWPLMKSPFPTIAIVIAYVLFVKSWGPFLMSKRPAFELRRLIMFYNLFLVLLSSYTFWQVGWNGWFTYYRWRCQLVDRSDRPEAMAMAHLTWLFFVSKLVELLDTVFFVLRKKYNQVTPLHMIHHTGMPLIMWWATKFVPGGHGSIIGLVNSLVHVIMYSYYFLAAFGPHMEPYLWWKKYITKLQIAQFLFFLVHSTQLLFVPGCRYPKIFAFAIIIPSALFVFMFGDFYRRSYLKDKHMRNAKKELNNNIKGS
ncbi:putative protein for very long chain fatty acid elongation [Halotydeus destructor]|nr:putative protein for very long chain fatty acid elongation [Halotydeus destructor]